MKKLFIASLVVGLLAFFALPGLTQDNVQDPNVCDVSFDVDVVKYKGITITKTVDKTFTYELSTGDPTIFPLMLAEVEAFKCDLNRENEVNEAQVQGTNDFNESFNFFTGIAQVNQAAGLLNNQGNVIALGFTESPTLTDGLSLVEAAVEKANAENQLNEPSVSSTDNFHESFNGFTGIAQVNQAAGILNNQNNVVALGANVDAAGLVAENDTFLSMQNTENTVNELMTQATASFNLSFNSFTGVAQVNQAPGNLNNQTNILSIAFAGR